MYSDKENVNILTALLVAHGVRTAVVCPGSRNAPIVHNLNECPEVACFPVTDERSAGFYALGMALATGVPVAVCVTSGSALLNLAPAVAEAFYQQIPLVVLSADRPCAWIDQLDGQTIPQPNALGCFVKKCVYLPEPNDEISRWHCNRLVNEALLETTRGARGPVHINVPITEPLYNFSVAELPQERTMKNILKTTDIEFVAKELLPLFLRAERPLIVVGQRAENPAVDALLLSISAKVTVLSEPLGSSAVARFDEVLSQLGADNSFAPDFVLSFGNTLVSKRLKDFLRRTEAEIWAVNTDGAVHDTFMRLSGIVEADDEAVLNILNVNLVNYVENSYFPRWKNALASADAYAENFAPEFSQILTIKVFEKMLAEKSYKRRVHYANSSSVRLANIFAKHYIYCNRGVNGIEGSLSTAAGMSVALPDEKVFCVIGDLSFLYDQNALWNNNLRGNFRILMTNNGGGGIFGKFDGLRKSAARNALVMAQHSTSAEGICRQNNVLYKPVFSESELPEAMAWLLTEEASRPMLVEVFTDAETDQKMLDLYYNMLKL